MVRLLFLLLVSYAAQAETPDETTRKQIEAEIRAQAAKLSPNGVGEPIEVRPISEEEAKRLIPESVLNEAKAQAEKAAKEGAPPHAAVKRSSSSVVKGEGNYEFSVDVSPTGTNKAKRDPKALQKAVQDAMNRPDFGQNLTPEQKQMLRDAVNEQLAAPPK